MIDPAINDWESTPFIVDCGVNATPINQYATIPKKMAMPFYFKVNCEQTIYSF